MSKKNMVKKSCSCLLVLSIFFGYALIYGQNKIMPLKEIKAGMKGECLTVLKGSQVESFPVEIIGLLKNAMGPKMDMILIRILGDKVKPYGVVSGMSGSPIYVDGKLIGALSYRVGFFAREPMAGVTPIEYMLKLEEKGGRSSASPLASAWFKELSPLHPLEALMKDSLKQPQQLTTPFKTENYILKPIETPLGFSGFHPAVMSSFSNLFQQFGFIVAQGGSSTVADKSPLNPGSSVAVQLVRGDMFISATGTVTHIDNERLLAFGHPLVQLGQSQMPMAKSQVLAIFPGINASFKITTSSEVIGTVVQDRYSGILGILGRKANLIPVGIELKNKERLVENFKFEMVSDRLLSPFLLNITVLNAIFSLEGISGVRTLRLRGKIKIKEKPEINISNLFSGNSAPDKLGKNVAAILYYLKNNPFQPLEIDEVSLSIDSSEQSKVATIERAWFSREEVRRGERLILFVLLKPFRGAPVLKNLPLRIPPSLSAGKVNVLVADNATVNKEERKLFQGKFRPRNLNHLIALLNSIRSADKVYVEFWRPEAGLIVNGEFMPALPPSLLSVFSLQQTPGSFIRLNYNLLDEETIQSDYIISGSKKLSLVIKE